MTNVFLSTGDNARARFTGNVAEDVDESTSFNLFYPAARSTGNTWAEAQASLTGQVQNGNITEEQVRAIVDKSIEKPFLGLLGTEKVNVLKLNIALEESNK